MSTKQPITDKQLDWFAAQLETYATSKLLTSLHPLAIIMPVPSPTGRLATQSHRTFKQSVVEWNHQRIDSEAIALQLFYHEQRLPRKVDGSN